MFFFVRLCAWTEVGINNIISIAQCNNLQRVKEQRKMRIISILISEVQHSFRNELFVSVEVQCNFAIVERHFRTKLKRNLTSVIEISQHNANAARFAILNKKIANNLLKKADIYLYCDRNETKLSLMYRVALLTEKKNWKRSAIKVHQILKTLVCNATSAIAEVALCALPISAYE